MNKLDLILNKKNQEKIVCLTAYSAPIAKIIDKYCDIILVGDSLAMTLYGMRDTTEVTLETMINHGKAVTNYVKNSLVIVDLPYGSYENSQDQALESAVKVIEQTKCDAVKMEISSYELINTVSFLNDNKINVVGHVGLLPQQVKKIGGYKYQGTTSESYEKILEISKKIDEAGAKLLVIEAVPEKLARKITESISIPTIGIGASPTCDGQILVTDDILGLNQEFKPGFVKQYQKLDQIIAGAAKEYALEVKKGLFPDIKHLR